MPDKPRRSVFVPLVMAMVVLGFLLFVTCVPILECNCHGFASTVRWGDQLLGVGCEACNGKGKVPLLNIWGGEVEETQ